MKECPSFPSVFVTEDGRVFKELSISPSEFGYKTVKFNGATVRRHTLLADAFLGPNPGGLEVRHLDGDSKNDAIGNLAYGTHTDNMQDAVKQGSLGKGHRKLSDYQILQLIARRKTGESGRALAKEFGISEQRVCDYLKGRVSLT